MTKELRSKVSKHKRVDGLAPETVRIKRKMQELRQMYPVCRFCGSTEQVEFVHLRETPLSGRGRGRRKRYYDITRNLDAYSALCKECHKEYDEDEEARIKTPLPLSVKVDGR